MFNSINNQLWALVCTKMIRWWVVAGLTGLVSSSYFVATDNRWFYKNIIMKGFQIVDAETAHVMAIRLAQFGLMPKYRGPDDKILASLFLTHCI